MLLSNSFFPIQHSACYIEFRVWRNNRANYQLQIDSGTSHQLLSWLGQIGLIF